ncbi:MULTISPECIES: hypothetical protein [Isoptericola]|uniref:Uncharacterized protein n=1 Tax=Isoptericola sediminis TaxID=2733572 RepID=A0A849K2J4_9MICO|nr:MULTISPECIES: hypothetical protein [Isoptericola]MDO8147377.1 hypothetical protein [Isoptericola sp. b515]NNU27438.1 hypothetical protein [Isoptericola sediminis]
MRNPTVTDVRAAVRWALSHDLVALRDYRQVTLLDRSARWQADAALVARWREATGNLFAASWTRDPASEEPSRHHVSH